MAGETKAGGGSRSRASAPTPEPSPAPQTIPAKLAEVRSRVSSIAKNGEHGQGYSYVQWGDALEAVRGHLDEVGLHLHLSVERVSVLAPGTVLVELEYAWTDVATGETLGGRWAGTGWDKGDKAVYKAYSGALKYLVLDTFLIPTGDEPEAGDQPPQDGSAMPGRQGSPRIPRERAERIVSAAQDAGLTQPVFQAKLADLGVSRFVDLTVDQAESLESFIAAEKSGASS